MKKEIKYKALDGTLFDFEREAIAHDEKFLMAEWYEENKLYGNIDGCRIEWEDLFEWIQDNKSTILKIIRNIDDTLKGK